MLIAVGIANLALDLWLLIILYRRGVWKQLPWFACYIGWGVLPACAGLASHAIGMRLYVAAYWWLEGINVLLIVGAMRESFLGIFKEFTSKRGFRWSLWLVIAGVLVYAALKAVYAPPIQIGRLASFILKAELAFRWGIAAVGLLSMVHMYFLDEPLTGREAAVVSGLGFASLSFLFWVVTSSTFGTRFTFLTQYVPTVGYFIAVFWWIWVFSRPVREAGLKDLGMEPEDVSKELGRYRQFTEWVMRQKW